MMTPDHERMQSEVELKGTNQSHPTLPVIETEDEAGAVHVATNRKEDLTAGNFNA